MKLGSLVEVIWRDHTFLPGVYRTGDLDSLVTWTSVGYLVRDDEELLILAQSLLNGEWHECLHIFPGLVVGVRELRTKRERSRGVAVASPNGV